MDDLVWLDNDVYVRATSSRVDDRTRTLKHGPSFGVFDRYGDIQPVGTGEQGLYHRDTRHLSRLELLIGDGVRPFLLNSTVTEDNERLVVDLANPDLVEDGRLVLHKGSVHIFRSKLLWEGSCHELMRLRSYAPHPVRLRLTVLVEADFADIFEVRGRDRPRRGEQRPPQRLADGLLLAYRGLDGVERRTRIRAHPAPTRVEDDRLVFELALAPGTVREIELAVGFDQPEERPAPDFAWAAAAAAKAREALRRREVAVFTSNEQFNAWLHRSAADLRMLVTETPHGPYPDAGVPWFATVFGRDGLVTALLTLWANPELARGVLRYLAHHQAQREDPACEAEPGKILHEVRHGEMARLGEVPFARYYGTIDATPLFVVLAGAYHRRTGDLGLVRELWPHVEAAVAWIDRYGDRDGDGFVEYARHNPSGLLHQGWKDSNDAVFHADGRDAPAPIALCEVQGYVYAARREAARLARLLGRSAWATRQEQLADALARRFHDAFWDEALGCYALALDGDKRRCRVRTSNAGQVLFTGIADTRAAARTVETLLGDDLFSGWGVRTVGRREARYNPMSYHNGSIWPHDNALIGIGMARYGHRGGTLAILRGLFEASLYADLHRLPELFCGFARRPGQGPTQYPVACSPQAWAAASVFGLLGACLGLRFEPERPRLCLVRPALPDYLEWLEIRNLRLGEGHVDLLLRRHGDNVTAEVIGKEGDAEVAVIVG
ncbi:glycogen debranching N-terminal domain-containing protein [Inmirania thermothiophila]|uniref:Glycogen debranching enzyme n=1 Tax=Inmirania thermothiophila TaxID=1750597 RepID=A0A3N1Y655_9GAMM|nr:glycogen debranching N-terminal domain-containing protein [Inmirania thermothiophila]ROR32797.1 glycogen debranching enzyme [Inmirania thermothiophila]